MNKVIILGSTGSLGSQTIEVLNKYPESFELIGLLANESTAKLKEQGYKYPAATLALAGRGEKLDLKKADIIINVLPGMAGIEPSLEALRLEKTLLLGNKESLVAEGAQIKTLLSKNLLSRLIPLDSEHNAIYEILKYIEKERPGFELESITLPCSGGPLLNAPSLDQVTPAQALAHPRWSMGPKVSLESATLINKGLELLEAYYLFDLPLEKIRVKIHPECQVHGMLNAKNGEMLAYLSSPDMREHIENALCRAIGLDPPAREIRPLGPDEFAFQEVPASLPGIQTVLTHFKKAPQSMKRFLQKEEEVLKRFLAQEISFLQIYKELES